MTAIAIPCAFVAAGPARAAGKLHSVYAKLQRVIKALPGATLATRVILTIPGQAPARLIWTDRHPSAQRGKGVLRFKNRSELLDGEAFRRLRDEEGAVLTTNDRDAVTQALGVSYTEPGIEDEEKREEG